MKENEGKKRKRRGDEEDGCVRCADEMAYLEMSCGEVWMLCGVGVKTAMDWWSGSRERNGVGIITGVQ